MATLIKKFTNKLSNLGIEGCELTELQQKRLAKAEHFESLKSK